MNTNKDIEQEISNLSHAALAAIRAQGVEKLIKLKMEQLASTLREAK